MLVKYLVYRQLLFKLCSFSRLTISCRKARANPVAPAALPVGTELATAVSVTAPDSVGGIPAADLCPVSVLLLGWVCVQLLGKNFTCKRGKWGKFNCVLSTVQQKA